MHQHGEFTAFQQVGGYKARPYIREVNIQVLHPGELCQGVDIGVLETFCCGVSRGNAQSLGACNGADDGNMSFAPCFEVIEGGGYHTGKTFHIGAGGVQFYFGQQVRVLTADAGAQEEQIHASQFPDKGFQLGGGVCFRHVQSLDFYLPEGGGLQVLQSLFPSSGNADVPALLNQQPGYFFSYAGGGTYDNGSFHYCCISS